MFQPSTHPYVGTERAYIAQGFSPVAYAPAQNDPALILPDGDTVTVESAWERDYLPGAPVLLYVRSHATGERTHVTAADLPLGVSA